MRTVKGYIAYNEIVPARALVVFTGSLCLQSICFSHRKCMLYVPQLAVLRWLQQPWISFLASDPSGRSA